MVSNKVGIGMKITGFIKVIIQYLLILLAAFLSVNLVSKLFPDLKESAVTIIFGIPFSLLTAFKQTISYRKTVLFFFLCLYFVMTKYH